MASAPRTAPAPMPAPAPTGPRPGSRSSRATTSRGRSKPEGRLGLARRTPLDVAVAVRATLVVRVDVARGGRVLTVGVLAVAPPVVPVLPAARACVAFERLIVGEIGHLLDGHHPEVRLQPVHGAHPPRSPRCLAGRCPASPRPAIQSEANCRSPSRAVPTRTTPDECRTAASRSPLMPADRVVAAGWAARRRAAAASTSANAVSGSAAWRRDGHQSARGATPGTRRRGRRGRAGRRRARRPSPGHRPRCTAAAREAGPVRRDSSQRPRGGAVESVGEARRVDRLDPVCPGHHGASLVALEAADEVPARLRVGTQRGDVDDLAAGLLSPVLPEGGEPEVEEQRDVAAGTVFVTAISSTSAGSRPAATHAAAIRARTAASRRASSARRSSPTPATLRATAPARRHARRRASRYKLARESLQLARESLTGAREASARARARARRTSWRRCVPARCSPARYAATESGGVDLVGSRRTRAPNRSDSRADS